MDLNAPAQLSHSLPPFSPMLPSIQQDEQSTTTEPFPEYFASCEQADSRADTAQEEAYKYALSKVVEAGAQAKRFDAMLMSTMLFTPEWTLPDPTTAFSNTPPISNTSSSNNNRLTPPSTPTNPLRPEAQTTPKLASYPTWALHPDLEATSENKKNILEELRILTNSPNLSLALRTRFITICNTILSVHTLLFRRVPIPGRDHPLDSLTQPQLHRAHHLANTLVTDLAALHHLLYGQYEHCRSAQQTIAHIAGDTANKNLFTRFKEMASILINTLPTPHPTEQRLLLITLDLYDAYLYTDYHRLRQWPQMLAEGRDPLRLRLTNAFFRAWDLLTRALECYQAIAAIHARITAQYLRPAGALLGREVGGRVLFDLRVRAAVARCRERMVRNDRVYQRELWEVYRREVGEGEQDSGINPKGQPMGRTSELYY
ncbi:hypothetical protein ASPACDRAFT_60628 [Aspergillus aculeatus ATCC 16872]|uniref:Uncharacterized protein n=1 Tax=Aspergillus aculeatus (strain ATCC 16872 / CBS 172.66 / WB 5094) TaxID=690307 RepID=A0A1L9WUB3_ASPA1|nr:uncharacterized protein ASPACDRAFT_60628 [Aspergillus aculeatus ATCC 16872]OJJ99800.1 hypothetical protein ASPACDRAFT_60628 [Aspergillus aculeatus ATCC 16872]